MPLGLLTNQAPDLSALQAIAVDSVNARAATLGGGRWASRLFVFERDGKQPILIALSGDDGGHHASRHCDASFLGGIERGEFLLGLERLPSLVAHIAHQRQPGSVSRHIAPVRS